MTTPSTDAPDRSAPTLLIVSMFTVLAAVGGVVAVALTDAGWAVLASVAVLVIGLVVVAQTMHRQLAEEGDDG